MNAGVRGKTVRAVMVLAHNEASHIVRCLDSIYRAEPERGFEVFVVANGCTDSTEEVVLTYAKEQPGVNLIQLGIADKCNAWNVYIHDVIPRRIPGRSVYFFMTGDAQAYPKAFSHLERALDLRSGALAAAAVPFSGRTMHYDRAMIQSKHGLVANLYALKGNFIARLQEQNIRLPLGLEGDDGLIGALVKWDLEPRKDWVESRIVSCGDAGFTFESLSWRRWLDWKQYWRRRIRYARRRYEVQLLRTRLKTQGIAGLPASVSDLYGGVDTCRVKWAGLEPLFCWLAKREMRRRVP